MYPWSVLKVICWVQSVMGTLGEASGEMGSAPGEGVKKVSVGTASARGPRARWAALGWAALGSAAGGGAACAEMVKGKEVERKSKECERFMFAAM